MDAEEIFDELDPLYQDLMKEQAIMKALEKDITVHLNELALKYYPEIQNLEKEGFEKLADLIWHVANEYVVGVNNIVGGMQIMDK